MRYKRNKRGEMRRGVEREVIFWIIALLILAFAVILGIILRKQGFDIIEQIKQFLRFGR